MSTSATARAAPGKPGASSPQVLEWVKVALIPIVIGLVGYFFTAWQKERDNVENNVRLYTQLISQREQSDNQLRTEMFKAVIEKFLGGAKSGDLRDMVLKLELLAYNFHESLDLGPVFKEVSRSLERPDALPAEERTELRKRLDAAAEKIIAQQVAALSLNGQHWSRPIDAEELQSPEFGAVLDEELAGAMASDQDGGRKLRLRVEVLAMDVNRREVSVRLSLRSKSLGSEVDRHFRVSRYDFPMLDNTRLPNGDRCSIVLTDFNADNRFAILEVVVFPATSASLKERIEFNELLRIMLRNKPA